MNRESGPRPRLAAACAAAALCVAALSACSQTQIREERYQDGIMKSQAVFVRRTGDALIRHGIQMAWYPTGGKESMETFVDGYRQGYAFRWHANGRMKSIEHYTDGMRDGQAKFWDEAGNVVACFTPDAADCMRASAADNAGASRFASRP